MNINKFPSVVTAAKQSLLADTYLILNDEGISHYIGLKARSIPDQKTLFLSVKITKVLNPTSKSTIFYPLKYSLTTGVGT